MLKQHLQFKLSQKLSPQQIQLMKLIQLPTQAFEQRIKQEMEENPALESGKEESNDYDDDYRDEFDNSYEDDFDGNDSIDMDNINVDEYLSDDEFLTIDFKPITIVVMMTIKWFLMRLPFHFINP